MSIIIPNRKITFALMLGAFVLMLTVNQAYANLGITPTIISFKDGERYKDVTLINTSEETKSFQMSWRFFKMQETGASYQPAEGPLSDFDVSKHVFFTPRRVTIPAKGSQKVRMAFRRPSEVPEGDFHAHLLFSPAETPVIDDGTTRSQTAAAGVSVKVGYSIPVIVRTGDFEENGEIGQINITRSENGALTVNVPISRAPGSHGLVGHLDLFHISANGTEKKVGEISNANIFTEIEKRVIPVALSEEISDGSLKIILRSGTKDDETIFDEEVFPLN